MTREEAIKLLVNATYSDEWQGNEDLTAAHNMAIEALEMVEEFEKAQIITGGRLNGRTYAYKCGLEDGKRKALEQEEYYKDLAQSYEKTIVKLTEAVTEQQPNEDCVSRQNVINYIRTLSCDLSYWSVTDEVVKDIEKLPPVTPTQGWIPVTEDAPPIGTICLWCNKQGSVFVSEITYRSEKFSYVGQHGYFCNGLKNHGNIVAWQPLPKPYKAEMESEE